MFEKAKVIRQVKRTCGILKTRNRVTRQLRTFFFEKILVE